MNRIIITLGIFLITIVSYSQKKDTTDVLQEAYMKSNKKMIDEVTPMMDFLSKYQDTSTTATQGDFNKLMSVYGAKETKNGMTKEQGFEILDWYIKASEGPKNKQEKEEIDETKGEDFPKTEEEKLKEKAESELPGQIKSIIGGMSYDDFKELMLITKPNATESQIRKEYQNFQNQAKKL